MFMLTRRTGRNGTTINSTLYRLVNRARFARCCFMLFWMYLILLSALMTAEKLQVPEHTVRDWQLTLYGRQLCNRFLNCNRIIGSSPLIYKDIWRFIYSALPVGAIMHPNFCCRMDSARQVYLVTFTTFTVRGGGTWFQWAQADFRCLCHH